jgi:tripartite-type tricarboxylate transporter receptor subunit TctC
LTRRKGRAYNLSEQVIQAGDKMAFVNNWRIGAAAVAMCGVAGMAQAQTFPERPITMVVAAAAGGPIDVFGRVLVERMSKTIGQRVLIENVGGGGGTIGGQRVARAAPDGYTVLLGTLATQANPQLMSTKPLYNPVDDFVHIGLIAEIPLVLVARKDLPANTMQEFAAYAKANPGKLNFGSAGVGSASHLGCVLLGNALGVQFQHIAYRGTGPAMQDLQGGRLDFLCDISVSAVGMVESGAVMAIATLSCTRTPVLPNVPSAAEGGTKIDASTWTALFAPKGTPAAAVEKIHAAMVEAMNAPETRAQLEKLGSVIVAPDRRSGAYLLGYVKSELEKWGKPIRESGAIPN